MTSEATGPAPDASERLFDGLLEADSLEAVIEAGAQALVGAATTTSVAVFLFDEGSLIGEAWQPTGAVDADLAAVVRAHAVECYGGPSASAPTAPEPLPDHVLALPLVSHRRMLGVAMLIGAPRTPVPRSVSRVAAAIACRAGAEIEVTRARALYQPYERWFKTLGEQIRVLDRERQKFAAIVHSTDAAVFVADLSRSIRWTNSVMTERSPEGAPSWLGLSCSDVCQRFADPREGEGCSACPVARALEENIVVHREYRDTRQGDVRSLYLTALPIRAPDGKPEEVMVMLQDLSDLEVLRNSEARYRLLFERSSRAIVIIDPVNRRIALANPTACGMSGHDLASLQHLGLEALHPATEWERLEPLYAKALADGALEAVECQLKTRHGELRFAVVTGTATDVDGRRMLMLEFRDVTETRRAQDALRIAEARLRTVVAGSPIILFATDREGIFTVSEGRGLASLGLKSGERVGDSVFDVYRDHPHVLHCMRRALAGEELTEVVEVGGLAFETHYSPLHGENGERQGLIGVATDVTERRRLADQLRQAQRMEAIGRLAGGVAHDFNNLLAAVLGHSELMIGRLEHTHPLRRNAEEIQKAASRGAILTRQLLAFGRKEVVRTQVIDVNLVVTGMEAMLRRLISEDIQLESITARECAAVRADRGQLEQIILNLAVNARDAMPHGGRLAIEVAHAGPGDGPSPGQAVDPAGPQVILTVSDSGEGMDAETLAHAFEPFFTTKERGKGTGLGLATVYGIVEQCGGRIVAQSLPGQGSTFRVYLPRVSDDAVELDDLPAPRPMLGGSETVLLVEDEDAVRATARESLESSGYTVIEARNGVEALEIAAGHAGPVHLVVSDVVMPRMGGGELAQRLAAARPETRVLFISGYPDDAMVRHGVTQLGSPLLQKPFTLADFIRKVRDVLDTPRQGAA